MTRHADYPPVPLDFSLGLKVIAVGSAEKQWQKLHAEEGVNLCSVTLPLAQSDMRFAASASQWVGCFYPGTEAQVRDDQIRLAGDVSADRLEQIWRAALLNERRHAENEDRRRALLAGLTQ